MTSMTMSMSMSSSFLLFLLRRPDISSSVGNLRDVVLLLFVREVCQMTVGGPAQSMAMSMTSSVMEKQKATKNTALTRAPRTSALAQPNVFLDQDFGAILTLRKAMTRAAISDNMWKLSATKAMELVRYPTMISTKKKTTVKLNMLTRRHFLPEYLPPPLPFPAPMVVFIYLPCHQYIKWFP